MEVGRHAPGGLGGAGGNEVACALVPPSCGGEDAALHCRSAIPLTGAGAQASFHPTRAPNPPAVAGCRTPRNEVDRNGTEVFIAPGGLGGAGGNEVACALVPPSCGGEDAALHCRSAIPLTGAGAQASFHPTRAPNPPAVAGCRTPRNEVDRNGTEVFITPPQTRRRHFVSFSRNLRN